MLLAGVVNGQNTGSTVNFVAMPGSNWTTITTSSNPNFTNINGVIIINVTGSVKVAEMSFDDINISAPVVQTNIPSFTTQPVNKTVCAGTSATYSGVATNAAFYSWLVSTDGLIWNPINASNAGTTFSGYNTNTLTVNNPSIALNGLYLGLTAVNSVGVNKGSNAVRLFVNSSPTVPAITGSSRLCVGSNTTLTNTLSGGVWSSIAGLATVNSSGVVTGNSWGNATIKYTVTNGTCSGFALKNIAISQIPATPSIGYKAPFSNPQQGAPYQGFCVGKVFGVLGSPSTGVWSTTGCISVTAGGIATINTTGAGSLTYTYTDGNGCSNSRTMTGTGYTCAARGISVSNNENQVTKNDFLIYPNPTKSYVKLQFEKLNGTGNIIVTDLYGKQIKSQQLSMGNNNVDLANLTKGLYFISTITNEGKTTKKLVIE